MPMRKDLTTFARRPLPRQGKLGPAVFKEHEIVRLSRDVRSPAGVIPKGTEATILQIFGEGTAYQVELEGPYEVPETVPASSLEARLVQPT